MRMSGIYMLVKCKAVQLIHKLYRFGVTVFVDMNIQVSIQDSFVPSITSEISTDSSAKCFGGQNNVRISTDILL